MKQIQLLDQHTINKIAAGEVVESPKSVVKELVENSIDAGATAISVEIKEGGISYLRIGDNGSGIPAAQVKTAFLRHATNKIRAIEDLEQVFSLGFRGEALASIAAVAQVELQTKTREEEIGTKIVIHGGEILSYEAVACGEGTTIVVQNLFYNVPARRKFLKKPATESGYISDVMNRCALGHPEVSFKYTNNQNVLLHTAGNNDLKTAMLHVYGKDVANSTLEISCETKEYRLTGLIGKPELSRNNRNYETLFINGRFIKNKVVFSAVEAAYKTRLLIGKFPVYVLHLQMAAKDVDVNVHPAKLEVRFGDEKGIYEFFYNAVVNAFSEEILIPKTTWEDKKEKNTLFTEKEVGIQQVISLEKDLEIEEDRKRATTNQLESFSIEPKREEPSMKPQEKVFSYDTKRNTETQKPLRGVDELLGRSKVQTPKAEEDLGRYGVSQREDAMMFSAEKNREKPQKPEPFFKNYTVVGQLFATYWVVEQGNRFFMIDQHAAHERVLYETLMERFRREDIPSQRLLSPVPLGLSQGEAAVLQEHFELFLQFGFDLEEVFPGEYALSAVPFIIKEPSGVRFFIELLDLLEDKAIASIYDTKILTIATMACKQAVKGNDRLEIQEANALIKQLLTLENPFTCPHGRPTMIEMTKYELEKKFKRIQN